MAHFSRERFGRRLCFSGFYSIKKKGSGGHHWYRHFFENSGLDGIWNDMNEPAILESPTKNISLDVRHEFDGQPCSHRKAHNVYGMLMAKSTLKD